MAEQPKPVTQKLEAEEKPPTSHQAVKFVSAATAGAVLLLLAGLTLTGTVIVLVLATPVLVIFSPILVPAGIAIFLAVTGFLFSGGFGVAALSALAWIYNYVTGKHPVGSDKIDRARMTLASKAKDMKEKAKQYGQYVQQKAQEASET
ncbi:hypothetical protein AMTRI_Chr05g67800 [Amborella trichopoda]|uniref:Oleosin n=1 Tax=Amborella trichopoda TaxID=13333 RepID=U5CYH5_AMBTC|nr:oleosin 1 [Amborella trichopoda]ERN15219.1 hypothetical protein AMTR_s00056p00188310 [Amborella trichopoda]|eukprot:XP_006853752.1 oleosin 1 [Amborella trichopoda]